MLVRHPWLGLLVCLMFVVTCSVILVGSPNTHMRRSMGLPAWAVAGPGVAFFGWLSVRYVRLIRDRRRSD